MKMLKLSVAGVVFRFYLMMAIILIAGFTGLWFLSILALPVFFSALMGIQLNKHYTVERKTKAISGAQRANEHLAHE